MTTEAAPFTTEDVDAAVGKLIGNHYDRELTRDDLAEIAQIVLTSAATRGRLLPADGIVWLVDTETGHEQPCGVFTSEQAAEQAAAKSPDLSYSSIFLNRIYS